MPLQDHEVTQALEINRAMARVGIPIFVAEPCLQAQCSADCRRRNKNNGTFTGFHLPYQWEKTKADENVVDKWRPGWAICAVGGYAADFIDVDSRSGGEASAAELYRRGMWPTSYGRAMTPSGGFHDIIAPLRVGTAAPIGNGTENEWPGVDLRGGRPDGEGHGFIYLAPTVRPSKVDGVPRGYRWVQPPDLAALVAQGPTDRSGVGIAAIALKPKQSKKTKVSKSDDFFDPPMSIDAANRRIKTRLDSVTAHAMRGWDGFRDTLRDASFEIGGFVGSSFITYDDAQQALAQAIIYAGHFPDAADLKWIEQGLDDGSAQPFKVAKEPPPRPKVSEDRSNPSEEAKKHKPRRLPLIPDRVWRRRPWLQAIRDRAHETAAVPDAVLGSALGIYSSSLPHRVKIRTGIQYDLGLSLLVGVVGGSGLGKSSGWKLARNELAPIDTPRVMSTPTGEGLIEELMGWVTKEVMDRTTATLKKVKEHKQIKNNALFSIGEGESMSLTMERTGATLGPVLRLLFSDEDLSTTNATEERKRYIPAGSYNIGVVVLYQETTAMKIINDTDTGTAQRFLWFSGHSPSAAPTGAPPLTRIPAPHITHLEQETGLDGETTYVLRVDPVITAKLREADAQKRDAYSLGDINRDSQKAAVVAKVAALVCLIEDRALITTDDWSLAEELYAASRAIQDELIEFAEEQDRAKRREAAAKAGEADHVRKSFRSEVGKTAVSITEKVIALGRPVTKRELSRAVSAKRRAYLPEAIEMAVLEQGWIKEVDGKFEVGPCPIM